MKTSIAQKQLDYYESKDFIDNYFYCLFETWNNNEGDIVNRIYDLFVNQNYETERELKNYFGYITKEQAKKIYEFIGDNLENFTRPFHSAYVGACSLESVSYGEQEEQLTGWRNHTTGNDYTLKYMQKVFGAAGYYVRGDYAYLDLSYNGLQVNLLACTGIELLDNFLLTIKD